MSLRKQLLLSVALGLACFPTFSQDQSPNIPSTRDPDHPVQQRILHSVAYYCGLGTRTITVAVDGCSAPLKSARTRLAQLIAGSPLNGSQRNDSGPAHEKGHPRDRQPVLGIGKSDRSP